MGGKLLGMAHGRPFAPASLLAGDHLLLADLVAGRNATGSPALYADTIPRAVMKCCRRALSSRPPLGRGKPVLGDLLDA
jgi:hypothetical protein